MKSQRMNVQSLAKPRASNLRYPSIYNVEDLTVLETSLGSTHRSRGTPSGPENICENAPTSRNDFKINEFATTKSYNLNSKELPTFPENLLETRESLDIGVERTEKGGDEDYSMIRSMPIMNKMGIVDRNSQKENMFDSYSKLYMSQNKKTMGSLKPLRELKITDRGQLSAASSHRTNGELKVNVSNESSSIRQLRGDHQEPRGLDVDEDEEHMNWKAATSMEIPKDRMLSASVSFKPEGSTVLRNIQNYRYNTPNFDISSLSKPNPTMSVKKTKFQENVKDFVQKKHDENARASKPLTMSVKYGDHPDLRKSAVIKGGTTPLKSTILLNKLEGMSRSTKRTDSNIYSSRILTRRDDLRPLKTKRNEKNCGDYFKNPVVFKSVLSFLGVNSLTRLTRVSKNFRMSENFAYIKKLQSKLIIHGLHKQEQYEFWNHRVDFDSLQQAFPMQFTINAHKKSSFERDILSDVDRTRLFNNKVAQRKESLLKILFAISNSMPKIGYVQGLNSIVAVFVSQDLKDHEVYWLVKYILKKKKFDGILTEGFPMVQLLNYQLEIYTRHYLPEIVHYLGERDLNLSYFTTQWFITMFSYDLELSQLIKVWNLFLLKGWKTVIKVSLALLWHFKDEILKKSADDLPFYLKNFLRERIFYVSEEALFKIAETFKVNNRILKTLEILYERSAPTNVVLFINPGYKPECKIASENTWNKNSIVYKDVMEYLNEDIDQMKIINKTKGNVSNELEHYRSIQNFNVCNSLIVDKNSGPTLSRNTRSSLNILDDIQPIDRLNSSQSQGTTTLPENGFLQTLTGLGKRLKQILTPKNNPPFLPRKLSDVKVANQEQEESAKENREPLSERVDLGPLLVLDRASSKVDSVSNSLDFSATSRSRDIDIGHHFGEKMFSEGRPFEFTLGNTRSPTEVSSGRNAMLKSRQVESPHNIAAQSVIYPGTSEYKHKRNSSMPYDQFGILTTFRNSRTSYFEQTSPNNLSLTESDNYPSARLAAEEIKDLRKSSSQALPSHDKGYYMGTEPAGRGEPLLQKTYSLEERVSSYVSNKRNASNIINGQKMV